MSNIGYYRYKTTVTDGREVVLYKNGIASGTAVLRDLPYCSGDVMVKYLDANGQYRFYTFNKFFETKDNPTLIGSTNKFLSSILTAQSDKSNIGYKNERKISLTTEATAEQLTYLSDIFTSPRVYLYVGTLPNDSEKDWLEVTADGDNIVKRRKAVGGRVDITLTLPEWYTIKTL
jgi:hypothetical protein